MIKQLLLAMLLVGLPCFPSQARTVTYRPIAGNPREIGQRQPIQTKVGDRIQLDFNQGFISVQQPSFLDFPILTFENGGAQTVLRVSSGAVYARVRRFTARQSYFEIADYAGNSALSRGTEFNITVGNDTMILGVAEGKVIASNIKKEARETTAGHGAIINPSGVNVFPIDYTLETTLKNDPFLLNNRVTGCLAMGNTILTGDQITFPDADGCFDLLTKQDHLFVQNPLGTLRRYEIPNAVKPFFGS